MSRCPRPRVSSAPSRSIPVIVHRREGLDTASFTVSDRMGGDELYAVVSEFFYGTAVAGQWMEIRHKGRVLPRSGLRPVGLFAGMVLHAARPDLVGP
jgi:hypothetical protein